MPVSSPAFEVTKLNVSKTDRPVFALNLPPHSQLGVKPSHANTFCGDTNYSCVSQFHFMLVSLKKTKV